MKEFNQLLSKLNLQREDTLILMGDYVDRGPDSKGVIDRVLELRTQFNVITLKGNHEDMMYKALTTNSGLDINNWMRNGGLETLNSYETSLDTNESVVVKSHIEFIESLDTYYETNTHIFVHASPGLTLPLEDQPEAYLIWRRPQDSDEDFNYTHISGKTIISGHTAQSNGKPKHLSDKNILIDTGCFFTGVLTAYDVLEDKFITNN